MSPERSTAIDVVTDFVASFVGSVACIYTGQPFDTIKVKLQTATAGQYAGNMDCIWNVWRTEGLTKLWAGSIPALMGAVSENAAAFALNHQIKLISGDKDTAERAFWEPFATGSVTGTSVCVYVYMCICVYVHMCICVYVYMCICVYVYLCTSLPLSFLHQTNPLQHTYI